MTRRIATCESIPNSRVTAKILRFARKGATFIFSRQCSHWRGGGDKMRLAPFLLLRVASALVNNQTYSAECATPTNCTLVPGRTDAALAWGRFDDGIERVGSADLWISSATVSVGAGFAAGYVEGALCAERIAQHYANLAAAYGVDPPSANLTAFLDANDAWLDEQLAGPKDYIFETRLRAAEVLRDAGSARFRAGDHAAATACYERALW